MVDSHDSSSKDPPLVYTTVINIKRKCSSMAVFKCVAEIMWSLISRKLVPSAQRTTQSDKNIRHTLHSNQLLLAVLNS